MDQAETGGQYPGILTVANTQKEKVMADQTTEQQEIKATTTPIGNGWHRHTIVQKLGARADGPDGKPDPTKVKPVPLTFAAFGPESEDNGVAWLTWMAETVLPAAIAGGTITKPGDDEDSKPETVAARAFVAEEYGSKLYGQNLKVRSKNKTGLGAPPVITIPGDRWVNLLTGEQFGKDGKTPVPGAAAMPIEDRVSIINDAVRFLTSTGKKLPGAYQTAIDGLTAPDGGYRLDGTKLVAVPKGNGKPAAKK